MADINRGFCNELLKLVHADVKRHFPNINLKRDAWTYNSGNQYEFHGPEEFYWHGRAYNATEARAKGWMAFLRFKGIKEEDDNG